MNFLERIFRRLDETGSASILQEIRGSQVIAVTGTDLLALVARARAFVASTGLAKGDRCALLASNSSRWVALDLALMAEGIIVVPLYYRQAPAELAAVVRDSGASRICCENAQLRDALLRVCRGAPPLSLLDEVFAVSGATSAPKPLAPADPVTIIYTSGTSGEPKGVVLTASNIDYMLSCTTARLDQLMGLRKQPDRVFHWTPLNFAASWISLLSYFYRKSVVWLSTDVARLADDMRVAAPNYFLNVPALLERVRAKIEDGIRAHGGWIAWLFARAKRAYMHRGTKDADSSDRLWFAAAKTLIFPTIRKGMGPQLKALICGSAPLAVETQKFFMMLGVPVLQVYGLTETTAICTLDDPQFVEAGYVGRAIPGIEMRLGENEEILVRGPNIFAGYWKRPQETAHALRGGWFHTGDQGETNSRGNWRITGRIKDLIILSSGHNIAPEPLEDEIARLLPEAQQVVLAGNGRSYLSAIVTTPDSNLTELQIAAVIEKMNSKLPHYKQIRAFHVERRPFTIENGLLTAMGKLKRRAIAEHLKVQIDQLYRKRSA